MGSDFRPHGCDPMGSAVGITPTCVKHVQQFLGFANYYNCYIAKFAALAAPLMDLLKKGMTWLWGPA